MNTLRAATSDAYMASQNCSFSGFDGRKRRFTKKFVDLVLMRKCVPAAPHRPRCHPRRFGVLEGYYKEDSEPELAWVGALFV